MFFGGVGGTSGIKDRIDNYQVAGETLFEIYDLKSYVERSLDLNSGIVNVKRETKNGYVTSKLYANCKSNLLVSCWESEKNAFSGKLSFSRVADENALYEYIVSEEKLVFNRTVQLNSSYKK